MTAEIRVGCSSWTSDSWWGTVYPQGMRDGDRLAHYSRRFDTVEVDSTYYAPPRGFLARRWASATPESFVFTLKMTRDLLDPKRPVDRAAIDSFLKALDPLGPKLAAVLLQFPPWVKPGRATTFVEDVVGTLPSDRRFALEVRDAGWFHGEPFERLKRLLTDRAIALTWSYLTYVDVPAEQTADFLYVRFIGDHTTIPAETHGELRVDRSRETRLWADRVRERLASVRQVLVFFNNHYAGFAPASVNQFRQELGLPPVVYAP